MQNFDSIASHLELVTLSRKFRTTEHAQWSAVEYFNFFSIEINLNLQDLYFHQFMGIMLQKQVIYWEFSIFRITTLDPCHRRHETFWNSSFFKILTLFRHSALATQMDFREKTKTKLSSKRYSGVLVFEVLAFEVLTSALLKFFIFPIFNTF